MKVSYNITQNKFNASLNQETTEIKVSFKTGYYPLPVGLENYYTKNETDLLLENYYLKTETYSQNEVDSLFLNETLDTVTERGNTTANEITVGGLTTKYVQLDTTSVNTYNIGKVYWNADKGTYNFGLKNNVELQLGQEQNVYGKAYSAITNGQLVMYRTSQGGHILFEPANFTQLSSNPDLIIGVATQNIALNEFGYITTFGEVNTLNTSSFADGNTLYFGSGNILQNTIPSGSYFIVGRVNRSHATQGSIFVKPYFVDNNLESKLNKQNNLTSDSDGTKYPTVNAVVGGLATKLDKGTYTGNASDLKSLIDTKINGSGTENYVSKFTASGTVGNSIVYDNGTNLGISTPSPSEKLDVNGYTKATGFKTPSGTATQSLTANGGTFDLNTKADLVGGKVPASQSRPSTIVMDNSTYVITFTDATGTIQTIDLPLESLFQDANYDETTKSLIVTLQDGTTRTVPLSDLVDLPEIVLATSNPAVTPTSGQKVYFNTSLGKVWFNVSGAWVFGGNLISDSEKDNLSTAYNHSQTTGNPHATTKSDIGLGNVDNTSDLNKPISTATQTALNSKLDKGGYVGTAQDLKNSIDNIQIGGRNLLLNTSSDWILYSGTGYGLKTFTKVEAKVGETFTGKVYVRNSNSPTPIVFEIHELNSSFERVRSIAKNVVNGEAQCTITVEKPETSYIEMSLFFGGYYPSQTCQYEYSKPKLEKGTVATDWTPAPEDKQDVLTNPITGTGTANLLPKFSASGTIANSIVYDNGTNVGIGTTTPTLAKLHVKGDNNSVISYFYNNSGAEGQVNGVVIEAGTNSSDYALSVGSSLGTSYLRVRGDGNVGIGTTSPSEKLDVNGNVLVQGLLKLKPQTSEPTGVEGAIYYNSTTKKHYGFDGTTWNALY